VALATDLEITEFARADRRIVMTIDEHSTKVRELPL
jgi:predicted nuclease of predicted toxin-antitoxin system